MGSFPPSAPLKTKVLERKNSIFMQKSSSCAFWIRSLFVSLLKKRPLISTYSIYYALSARSFSACSINCSPIRISPNVQPVSMQQGAQPASWGTP